MSFLHDLSIEGWHMNGFLGRHLPKGLLEQHKCLKMEFPRFRRLGLSKKDTKPMSEILRVLLEHSVSPQNPTAIVLGGRENMQPTEQAHFVLVSFQTPPYCKSQSLC